MELSTSHLDGRVAAFQTSFRFEAWVNTWPLNRMTVLDYFRYSDFYDRSCNNEQLIMQQNVVDASKITHMVGLEYEVDASHPRNEHYFLIRKQYRSSPRDVQVLALYYVVGLDPPPGAHGPPRGTVFPLPDLQSVFVCNLQTCMHHTIEAFRALAAVARPSPERLEAAVAEAGGGAEAGGAGAGPKPEAANADADGGGVEERHEERDMNAALVARAVRQALDDD